MAQVWGNCQKKRIPKRHQASGESVPAAAEKPMSVGNAPEIAPGSVDQLERRFIGV